MVTLMDWMLQIEYSRASLSRSGQERLAQLAYLKQKPGKQAKATAQKQEAQASTLPVRCCAETTA